MWAWFALGLVTGLLIGVNGGLIIFAMLHAADEDDLREELRPPGA